MFVDTSALVAIILDEPEADGFLSRLEAEKHRCTSPLVVLETTMVLSSHLKLDILGIRAVVGRVLQGADIEVIPINARMGDLAVEAFDQYGKGRHPARLNLGDCMSYAVAKAYRAPLLYKGDDFKQTDLA
jgi:ribonuclease VapC